MSLLKGPYELEEVHRLGSGGMGEVWLARLHHAEGTEEVALKRIRADLRDQPEFEEQLRREARVCGALVHPNIVALRAFGIDGKGPYLALEYVDGHSASTLLKRLSARQAPLPVELLVSIARDTARALAFAHGFVAPGMGTGVIHRDVSPDNILLTRSGCTKLSDFGIAKLEGSTTMTRTGTMKGKLGYMAPELFDGAEADARADVFAFGVTLYKLATNVAPFHGRTEAETLRAVLHATPARLSALRPDLPASFEALVHACLDRRPDARPASMAQVARALEGLAENLQPLLTTAVDATLAEAFKGEGRFEAPASAPRTRSMPWRRRRVRGRRGKLAWAGAALVLLLAAGGAWVFHAAGHRSKQAPVATSMPPPTPSPTPSPAPSSAPVHSAPVDAAEAPRAASTETAPPRAPEPAPEKPHVKSAPARARLWVKVSPWAEVFIDGRSAGTTPMPPQVLAPGAHQLVLINANLLARRVMSVSLKPGESRVVNVILEAQKRSVRPAPSASPPETP